MEIYHGAHKKTHGHSSLGEIIQVVNLHLQAVRKQVKPWLQKLTPASDAPSPPLPVGEKLVWFEGEQHVYVVFRRADLRAGHKVKGPAIVHEREATTLIARGWKLLVDGWGNPLLENQKISTDEKI